MADIIKVMRNEKKYIISLEAFRNMYAYFSKVLHPDEHDQGDGYMVRSLYFDTYTNSDYFNKIDGLKDRKKIRLRIYDMNSDTAKLELKQKNGQYQLKQSIILSKDDAINLVNGSYSVLLNYENDLVQKLYYVLNSEAYRPRSIVEYKRIAFVLPENNIRLNFDYNIMATESNLDLFSSNLNLYPVCSSDRIIFEVKYNHFLLSYIKDIVSKCNKSETAVSKYCLSRNVSLL